jgi:hypothetical protein
MFIAIATYQAKAGEEDAILAFHELLERKQGVPVIDLLSCELLRSSTVPGKFTTIVRATNNEVLQAVLDELEQDGHYSRFLSLLEGPITWCEYTPAWSFQ